MAQLDFRGEPDIAGRRRQQGRLRQRSQPAQQPHTPGRRGAARRKQTNSASDGWRRVQALGRGRTWWKPRNSRTRRPCRCARRTANARSRPRGETSAKARAKAFYPAPPVWISVPSTSNKTSRTMPEATRPADSGNDFRRGYGRPARRPRRRRGGSRLFFRRSAKPQSALPARPAFHQPAEP